MPLTRCPARALNLLVLALLCFLCPPARATQDLASSIHAAAAHLHSSIAPDGRLRYRQHALTGQIIEGRYNVLRHAGSLLALAEYHQTHAPSLAQIEAIDSAFGFLRNCCLAPAGVGDETDDRLAVWSPPELVGGSRRYAVAKLGGAGLTLAALVQWRLVRPEAVAMEEMRALARFIVSQQRADGGFRSLHAHRSGQHDPHWESLYYPGEAALGLVLLHELDRSGGWLVPAMDALRYLARQREGQASQAPDHWALIATARLFAQPATDLQQALPPGFSWEHAPGHGHVAVKALLQVHAQAVVRHMLGEQGPPTEACAIGAFTTDGRTTPTATRLEGLVAIAPWLPRATERDAAEHQAVVDAVAAGVTFLRAAQLASGLARGGFSRVSPRCPTTDVRAHEVRVDQTQHALSALLGHRALLKTGAGAP
ncbi:hypothetical protein [Hydrogenophaga sp.]|uniref:hypothetical protein n=1 Tax=Hydrogenophaga sp. TaxID=1904254 RepID=UPI002722D0FB|nr:hypothetical protein [Hydrogenophaga sp.]MDO8906322.1 hypothetical protein [Hydrogenophaga sp.]